MLRSGRKTNLMNTSLALKPINKLRRCYENKKRIKEYIFFSEVFMNFATVCSSRRKPVSQISGSLKTLT